MTFPEAIKAIIDGHRVTRREWGDPDTYVFMGAFDARPDEYLCIHNSNLRPNPGVHTFIVRDGDILADDWELAKTTTYNQ